MYSGGRKNYSCGNSTQEPTQEHQWCHHSPSCRFWESIKHQLMCPTDARHGWAHMLWLQVRLQTNFILFCVKQTICCEGWCGRKMAKESEVFGTVKHTWILHAFLKGHAHALAWQTAHSAHSAELILIHTEGWVNRSTLRACGLSEQQKHIKRFWRGHGIRRCKSLQQRGHAPQLGHPHSSLMLRTWGWRD